MTTRSRSCLALVAATGIALAGCATPPPPLPADASVAGRCERAFAALDAAIDAAGVRDAEATRIAGFPAVRVTRFLASFADAPMDAPAFEAWHARLVDEDRRARLVEIANLPPAPTRQVLDVLGDEGFATLPPPAFLDGCGQALAQRDAADPARRAALVAAARVPDDYDDGARAVGLYPLTRVAAAAGVRAYERGVHERFARPPAPTGTLVTWRPPQAGLLDAAELRALLDPAAADPLGVPPLDDVARDRLLATFAPVLVIDERDGNDRPGRPVFGPGNTLGFAPAPVVFGRIAFTRFDGATHVQLVYTVWFAARVPAYPGDPLAGTLDGVLWRVTLDHDGAPLVFDAIHACGCYALFVPTARLAARPRAATLDEQALVPATLPALAPGTRVAVHLAAGTHHIHAVRAAEPGVGNGYRIGVDDALRSIPLPGGGTRSLYGPDGIVDGTQRNERLLFWPLGIRDAGAMRQWGRHATAFVGRRHFDDAFLLDRYFVRAR